MDTHMARRLWAVIADRGSFSVVWGEEVRRGPGWGVKPSLGTESKGAAQLVLVLVLASAEAVTSSRTCSLMDAAVARVNGREWSAPAPR